MRLIYFLIMALFLVHCAPVDYDNTFEGSESFNVAASRNTDSVDDLNQTFYSDKLDLVIVLDTGSKTKPILGHNIFGADFMEQFQDYDWRLAWTNTSMDEEQLEQLQKKSKGKKCRSGGLLTIGLGLLTQNVLFASTGLNSVADCIGSLKTPNNEGSNGKYLAFENKNKKIELAGNYLTKDTENYSSVFHQTMSAQGRRFFRSYDAPNFKETYNSYPLVSTVWSFLVNEESDFIREDSQVVYIIVSPVDSKGVVKAKDLRANLKKEIGIERFQMIPVTVPATDAKVDACSLELREQGVKFSKGKNLDKLAKELGNQSLSICSDNLGEELAQEIKKYIYPEDIL